MAKKPGRQSGGNTRRKKRRSPRAQGTRGKGPQRARRGKPKTRGPALVSEVAHIAAPEALDAGAVVVQATVDFSPRSTDRDVSNDDDAELGNQVRMRTERGDGAWVFEAADAEGNRRRWIRTVPR